jgi:hypothetical protein
VHLTQQHHYFERKPNPKFFNEFEKMGKKWVSFGFFEKTKKNKILFWTLLFIFINIEFPVSLQPPYPLRGQHLPSA